MRLLALAMPQSFVTPRWSNLQQRLVTVTPLVVLGPDVLVRVFDALLQGRQVLPVLPVLIPEDVRVDAGGSDADGNATMRKERSGLVLCFALCGRADDLKGKPFEASERTPLPGHLPGRRGSVKAAVCLFALLASCRPGEMIWLGSGWGDVIQHGDILPESWFPSLVSVMFFPNVYSLPNSATTIKLKPYQLTLRRVPGQRGARQQRRSRRAWGRSWRSGAG